MIRSHLLSKLGGYVGDRWVETAAGSPLEVRNPSNGDVLALLPDMGLPDGGEAEALKAIETAESALSRTPSLEERRRWLQAIADAIRSSREELGRIITLENGKPLKESMAEADYAAGFFRHFARELDSLQSEVLTEPLRNCRWGIHRRPAGVAALITPWNFPLAMVAKKLSAALGAGAAVVAKPARLAPLATIALWNILEGLGLPLGRLQLLLGSGDALGNILCRHPAVRVLSLTGSTEAGRALMARCAPHLKRLALELGGSAPFIVFEDADVDAAAAELVANKFRCAGQTCVCANRVFVHCSVAGRFVDAVVARAGKLKVGDGMDPAADVGPLIHRQAFDKVAEHVGDAIAKGARRVLGSDPPRPENDWGAFYPPTVLVGVTREMRVFQEETFGPVIATASFDDEASVVREANATPYGLAAYFFTRDRERARDIAARLAFGHVGCNTATGPTPEAPFGGMKESGFGREGGIEGFYEFCETQVVVEG